MILKPIADLYVQCSLKVSHFDSHVTAMSDCCREFATSGVQTDTGTFWRCNAHEGVLDFRTGATAPVVLTVLIKE